MGVLNEKRCKIEEFEFKKLNIKLKVIKYYSNVS
jgi:hypothetical protein